MKSEESKKRTEAFSKKLKANNFEEAGTGVVGHSAFHKENIEKSKRIFTSVLNELLDKELLLITDEEIYDAIEAVSESTKFLKAGKEIYSSRYICKNELLDQHKIKAIKMHKAVHLAFSDALSKYKVIKIQGFKNISLLYKSKNEKNLKDYIKSNFNENVYTVAEYTFKEK